MSARGHASFEQAYVYAERRLWARFGGWGRDRGGRRRRALPRRGVKPSVFVKGLDGQSRPRPDVGQAYVATWIMT